MLKFLELHFQWYLIKYKWYRKRKGGTWYKIWVYDYPYITYWTPESELLQGEIPYRTEYHH